MLRKREPSAENSVLLTCGTDEMKRFDDKPVDEAGGCSLPCMHFGIGSFAACGEQKVFYVNYRVQRSCRAGWEDKKYHLDKNGFVKT